MTVNIHGREYVTVAERLRKAGWDTRAWINNPNLSPRVGLHQGFSNFVDYATGSREAAAEPFAFFDASEYAKAINSAKEEIEAGEVYQVCLTHRTERDCDAAEGYQVARHVVAVHQNKCKQHGKWQ